MSSWLLSTIYANTLLSLCKLLWDEFLSHWIFIEYSLSLCGNLNTISSSKCKVRGRPLSLFKSVLDLKDFLFHSTLINLRFPSTCFTWSNNHSVNDGIVAQLDRFLTNYHWVFLFHEFSILHFPKIHSDYSLILAKMTTQSLTILPNPFALRPFG